MSEKLKPCPFCGGEVVPEVMEDFLGGVGMVLVGCGECRFQIGRRSRAEAIAAWNRRSRPSPSHAAPQISSLDELCKRTDGMGALARYARAFDESNGMRFSRDEMRQIRDYLASVSAPEPEGERYKVFIDPGELFDMERTKSGRAEIYDNNRDSAHMLPATLIIHPSPKQTEGGEA